MRFLVLGGGGFLGSHIATALVEAGHAVRIFERERLSRENVRHILGSVEFEEGDFTDPVRLTRSVKDADVIVHCIGTTHPKTSNENPVYDIASNLIPTLHLLDAAVRERVRKVIFLSSGGTVYGIARRTPIPEDHPTEPVCSYGIQKLAIEKYLRLYRELHGLDFAVMRISNPFGERQRPAGAQGAVTVFLHTALRREPIEIWGDGSVVRDYIYVSDVAEAVLALARHEGEPKLFNVGTGVGRSLLDVCSAIESVIGRKVEVVFKPARAFDVPMNVLDISQAALVLGWRPATPFQEGLRRSVAWLERWMRA